MAIENKDFIGKWRYIAKKDDNTGDFDFTINCLNEKYEMTSPTCMSPEVMWECKLSIISKGILQGKAKTDFYYYETKKNNTHLSMIKLEIISKTKLKFTWD